MKKTMLTDIIAALFILLFVYAAASKLMEYQTFRAQLIQSPLVSSFAGSISLLIPTIEIVVSLLLFTNRWRLAGLYSAFSLMSLFTVYIIVITRYSEYIPCSCGGILSNMGWHQHLVFNIACVALAMVGILFFANPTTLPPA